MKAIIAVDIHDADALMELVEGQEDATLESGINADIYKHTVGLDCPQVILEDSLEPNDQLLGARIRKLLK